MPNCAALPPRQNGNGQPNSPCVEELKIEREENEEVLISLPSSPSVEAIEVGYYSWSCVDVDKYFSCGSATHNGLKKG